MPLLRVLAGPDNAPGSRVRAFDFGDPGSVDVSALTVYDMVKAADKSMEIGGIHVQLKDGGKSGRYEAQ